MYIEYIIAIVITVVIGISIRISKRYEIDDNTNTKHNVWASQDTWDGDNHKIWKILAEAHKAGDINLIGVDITGVDTAGKAGLLVSAIFKSVGVDIPIIINHGKPSRVTNTYNRYHPSDFKTDGLPDASRPGIKEMANLLSKHKDVTYIVGGHLTTLDTLLIEYPAIVNRHISEVVISEDWNHKTFAHGTNLACNVDTVKATNHVWKFLPKHINLLMINNEYEMMREELSISGIKKNTPLLRFIEDGPYFNGSDRYGDSIAFIYGMFGLIYKGTRLFTKRRITLLNDGIAAIKESVSRDRNHFIIENTNKPMITKIVKKYINK